MKKIVFFTEISYVIGLIVLAIGTAIMEKCNFGMSMVVAPAYLFHLKMQEYFSWFTFGVAEYTLQAILIIAICIVTRRIKLLYLFSFITAVIYGYILDLAIYLFDNISFDNFYIKIVMFIIGMLLCSFGVSLLFRTYFAPEAYELFVKEYADIFKTNINITKTVYDCVSCIIAVIMSFAFFGLGHFEGVKIGTVICALVNGFIISRCTKIEDKLFDFKDGLNLKRFF